MIDYAAILWDHPSERFRERFEPSLADLKATSYAQLTRAEDGSIRLAEKSYAS